MVAKSVGSARRGSALCPTPEISVSIIPAPGSAAHRLAFRCRRTAAVDDAASTTAGLPFLCLRKPSLGFSQLTSPAEQLLGDHPCRRATAQTESPLVAISATIRALSSSRHARRRPLPVKTSSRRICSVIALCSVSIPSLTVKNQTADSQIRALSGRCPRNTAYSSPMRLAE